MVPAYLKAFESGKLAQTIEQARQLLSSCELCPRACKINRLEGKKGVCKTGFPAEVYSFMPHHGEEPAISGERGSGTIFFSQCTMRCCYCQNFEFSQAEGQGRAVNDRELADIMLELQGMGCHNLNFVTPTHVMPQILAALVPAIEKGLNIPLVYNTSGYELPEMVRLLDGIIDIYLPDMRYADNGMAVKYSQAPDYPAYNQASVREMHRQTGVAQMDDNGIIERGVIIRHLVLPGNASGTEKVMEFIAQELSPDTYISLMSQYMPSYRAGEFPELNRRITLKEYEQARAAMEQYGLHNGWIQESRGLARFAGTNIKPSFKK